MAEMSNYLENALINATLRATTFTSPAAVYVSLHTADPTDTGANEITASGYIRKAASFGAPSDGVSTTNADITFDQANTAWGTITHVGIWDSDTSGNLYYHTALDAAKTIDTGDIFKIASGNLTVTLA